MLYTYLQVVMFSKKKKSVYGEYLDEAVYGANDGIITTFAVISSATGATLGGEAIIILGIANLVADGFSMGASSYLSIRTEEDVQRLKRFWKRTDSDAVSRSLTTFGAFVLAGSIPLIPFFSSASAGNEFLISAVAAGVAFFLVGGSRTIITKRGFFVSGLEMFIVGGIAATLAYSIGYFVHALVA